jgi:hypothetical protein
MKFRLLAFVMVTALAAGLLSLTGRAQDASTTDPAAELGLTYPELQLVATDHAFEVVGQATAGHTLITLVNDGAEPHHAQLMLLNEGQTFETVQAALSQSPDAIFGLGQFVGGPSSADPGGRSQVILDLAAGQYLALCFIAGDDGVPHLAKGMVQVFAVAAATGEAAEAPQAAVTVTMRDMAFDLPTQVAAGPQIWEIVNDGPQPHEIALLKLAPGLTPEQALAIFAGPPASPEAEHDTATHEAGAGTAPAVAGPPFTSAGGMQGMAAGLRGWAVLDLEPGNYLAVCFIPDPATGQPHVALGMVGSFTVE